MEMVNVLVFPCGTEIGLEIHNSLRFSSHINLIGANSVSDHGKYVYNHYIEGIPYVDCPDFVDAIKKVINKNKIDLIFPAHDSVVLKLVSNKEKLGCRVITSSLTACQICRSKKKTYEFFKFFLRVPRIYQIKDKNITFPVFLKPEVGQGTKGTFTANSYKEIEFYIKKNPELLILEFLPGKEYTIDCFTDRFGDLRFIGPRVRSRILNGISVNSFPIKNSEFIKIADKINSQLEMRGVWFFQAKEDKEGKITLMEIAPRVGGTMGLTRNMGVNLPLLSVFDALDKDVEIIKNQYRIEVDRALISRFKIGLNYNHVYVDLDDTISNENGVNPWIMAFLYQCINKKIKLHLLTRHKKTHKERAMKILLKFRLRDIFDEVIDVHDKKEKYEYIKSKDAIFIDDSFSERKKVFHRLKIPTFDCHMIESLINWKY